MALVNIRKIDNSTMGMLVSFTNQFQAAELTYD